MEGHMLCASLCEAARHTGSHLSLSSSDGEIYIG